MPKAESQLCTSGIIYVRNKNMHIMCTESNILNNIYDSQ